MNIHPHRRNLFWPLAIFFAATLTFEPALFNTFTFDDMAQVRDQAPPTSLNGWLHAAAQPWWPPDRAKNLWRPVTRLTILAQKALTGDSPLFFYAFNIILHGAVAVLLFFLACRLGFSHKAAGLGALLFAAHPAHAETVHQVVGRAELLAAFLMLAGLYFFWDALRVRAEHRAPNIPHTIHSSFNRFWIAQPCYFALALGAKEHALIYPALLIILVLVFRNRNRKTPLPPPARLWPFFELLSILLAIIALFFTGKFFITGGVLESPASVPYYENPLASMPASQRLPAALGILGYAASRLVWPLRLAPDYSAVSLPFEAGWAWPHAWLGLGIIVSVLAWSVLNCRRGRRGWALAAAALASYLLVSNLIYTIGVSTAQRLWYWPSAPVCLGAGWLLAAAGARLPARLHRTGALLAGALFVALLALAWRQAGAWRSPEAFARATIQVFPQSWRGQVDTARACYRERDFAAGREHALAATRVFADLADGWAWLGSNAMFLEGRQAEAEAAFKVALTLNPALYEVHRHYGHLLAMLGRRAEAAAQFQAFLEADGPSLADREKINQELEQLLSAK